MAEKVQYLTEKEVSDMTRLALPTLRNYRCLGKGPAYVVAGERAIRYRLDDVVSFMEHGRILPGEKK